MDLTNVARVMLNNKARGKRDITDCQAGSRRALFARHPMFNKNSLINCAVGAKYRWKKNDKDD